MANAVAILEVYQSCSAFAAPFGLVAPHIRRGCRPRQRPTFWRGGRREASCQWLRSQPWQADRCFMVPRQSAAYLGGPVVGACSGLRWRANSASRCSVLRQPAGEACCPCPSSPAVARATVRHRAECRGGPPGRPVIRARRRQQWRSQQCFMVQSAAAARRSSLWQHSGARRSAPRCLTPRSRGDPPRQAALAARRLLSMMHRAAKASYLVGPPQLER